MSPEKSSDNLTDHSSIAAGMNEPDVQIISSDGTCIPAHAIILVNIYHYSRTYIHVIQILSVTSSFKILTDYFTVNIC